MVLSAAVEATTGCPGPTTPDGVAACDAVAAVWSTLATSVVMEGEDTDVFLW